MCLAVGHSVSECGKVCKSGQETWENHEVPKPKWER